MPDSIPWWGWLIALWLFGYLMSKTIIGCARALEIQIEALHKILIDIRDEVRQQGRS